MKTITLTAEQELFINGLTESMETQSNRATQYPLFYVYEKEDIWVDGDASSDRIAFTNDEGSETNEEEDSDGNVWKFDGDWSGDWRCEDTGETIDEDEAIERFGLRRINLKEIDKPVVDAGPFLTEAAAQRHIDTNSHHYNKPYIYVNSCFRNYEMQGLLQLLFALAGKEVPSQYK